MERYNIGDIVKLKMLEGDNHYYMVTDFVDFSVKDGDNPLSIYEVGKKKRLDVDYEIVLIHPVEDNPPIENTMHDELTRIATFKSREYDLIIDYMYKERFKMGYSSVPQNIKHVMGGMSAKPTKKKTVKNPKVKSTKFGMAEINDILNDDSADEKIKEFIKEMDKHLDLLGKAMKDEGEEEIKVQKERLEEIRQTLMELEYFPFKHNRR